MNNSNEQYSSRNRGLARALLDNYLWNWSDAFKSAVPEDARRAAKDLTPCLARELERVDRIHVEPDFPYRRHVFTKALVLGATTTGVIGDVAVDLLIVRFLLDRIFSQVRNEWAEIHENVEHDANGVRALMEEYGEELKRGRSGPGSPGHFYARRMVEDHLRLIDELAGVETLEWGAKVA